MNCKKTGISYIFGKTNRSSVIKTKNYSIFMSSQP